MYFDIAFKQLNSLTNTAVKFWSELATCTGYPSAHPDSFHLIKLTLLVHARIVDGQEWQALPFPTHYKNEPPPLQYSFPQLPVCPSVRDTSSAVAWGLYCNTVDFATERSLLCKVWVGGGGGGGLGVNY
jgi:hypothetical protein